MNYHNQINALIKLSRWKEHIPFTIPITLLGALIAAYANQSPLDWRIAVVVLANILVVTYAFMINDIEDAPDDARDPERAKRNPISNGDLSSRRAYIMSALVALAAMLCFAVGGERVLLTGLGTLLASHLYSWRLVRLKAWPLTDVTSHSLMLGGLLFLAGYFAYASEMTIGSWLMFGAITLGSIHGQLHYQVRDYELDKLAGLYNTCIALGVSRTRVLLWFVAGLVVLLALLAIFSGVMPQWVLLLALLAAVTGAFVRPASDMRGDTAEENSGKLQQGTLLAFNVMTSGWLLQALLIP